MLLERNNLEFHYYEWDCIRVDKCICGVIPTKRILLDIDGDPEAMPCCGRKLVMIQTIKVFEEVD